MCNKDAERKKGFLDNELITREEEKKTIGQQSKAMRAIG